VQQAWQELMAQSVQQAQRVSQVLLVPMVR